jgi:hypothetical protein
MSGIRRVVYVVLMAATSAAGLATPRQRMDRPTKQSIKRRYASITTRTRSRESCRLLFSRPCKPPRAAAS